MSIRKKAYVDINFCVACGICMKNCPISAINIEKGIYANINHDKCVGCAKCFKLCPASVIEMK